MLLSVPSSDGSIALSSSDFSLYPEQEKKSQGTKEKNNNNKSQLCVFGSYKITSRKNEVTLSLEKIITCVLVD